MTDQSIDEIFTLLVEFGDVCYGEDVSQMEHSLQCARIALIDGASPELIAASLLHDIGQFLNDAGNAAERRGVDARHEVIGANYLSRYFPKDVTEPVRLHVEAKRFLCAAEPGYRDSLSAASGLSLRLQGGPFDRHQSEAFLERPFAQDAIRLRRFDDQAKRRDWQVPDLDSYVPLLQSLLLV